MTDEQAICATLRNITTAWREGRLEELEDLLRPDVVYVAPSFAGRLAGREACIASYRDFLGMATIHDYVEDDPEIDVFEGAAVATFGWEIDYTLGGERQRERGHDIDVLVRDEDRWRVAWRTLV